MGKAEQTDSLANNCMKKVNFLHFPEFSLTETIMPVGMTFQFIFKRSGGVGKCNY